ncbi:ComEA family DNA-binding protein [Pseudonocardia sp. NPDC046786]|uniref:ComEA family DNA-binding protein n=1 Tax=Pseudonocardia sp. NPDC046786 TaxID=3155471 RepID=UPI0033E30C52
MTRSDVSRVPSRRLAGLTAHPPRRPPAGAPDRPGPAAAPGAGGRVPEAPTGRGSDPPTVPLDIVVPGPVAAGSRPPGRSSARPAGAAPHGARPSLLRRTALRWLPPSLSGARVDPGRPAAIVLVGVVLGGALLAGAGVWSNRPTAQPVAGLPEVTAAPVAAAGPEGADLPDAAAPVTAGPLVISVVGRVARPGLVRIPDGSRVADAVDAVGGALPGVDLTGVNLARRVGDGEQIAIGVPGAAPDAPAVPGGEPASGAEPGAAGAPGTGKVDLNRATAADLDALPGVGPVTATKIVDWRTANGRFSRVEQLREIDGIGERRFAQLKDLVRV